MLTVWKYPLKPVGQDTIKAPRPAKIISVGKVDRSIMAWVLVDTEAPFISIPLIIKQTGEPFAGNEDEFIGTVVVSDIVSHVFHRKVAI